MLFLMWIRKNPVIANADVLYQSIDCLRTHLYDARSWEVSVAFHIFNMEVSCSKSRCCLYHQQIFSWSMSQLISFGCWFRFHYLSTIISMHYTTLEIIIQDYWTSIEEAPQSRCLFFSRNLFHIKNSPSFHIPRGSISRPAPQEMLRCRSADLVAHELLVASLESGTAGTMGLLGLPRVLQEVSDSARLSLNPRGWKMRGWLLEGGAVWRKAKIDTQKQKTPFFVRGWRFQHVSTIF